MEFIVLVSLMESNLFYLNMLDKFVSMKMKWQLFMRSIQFERIKSTEKSIELMVMCYVFCLGETGGRVMLMLMMILMICSRVSIEF